MGNESKTEKCIIKKEDAIDILDRIIGFVNNCDSKSSIILGVFGAVITLVFSTDGIAEIRRIFETAFINNKSFCNGLFLLLWCASVVIFIVGIYNYLMVLIAKIDCTEMKEESLELDSKVYFENISKNNTYKGYKEKLYSLDEVSLMNDLTSQIYINSCICTAKFKRYNKGLRFSFLGLSIFFVLWGIGSFLY